MYRGVNVAALLLLTLLSSEMKSANTPKRLPAHVNGFGSVLPLAFEPNRGQTDPLVRYLSRGPGYSLYLTTSEAVLVLQSQAHAAPESRQRLKSASYRESVVRLQFQNANPEPRFIGESPLQGISNYFIGSNPENWRTHIPNFARVRVPKIYPGIDLVYYGNAGQLEYDFRISAGTDPGWLALHVSGIDKMYLDPDGSLVMKVGDLEIRNAAPVIYQEDSDKRVFRHGRYAIRDNNNFGFQIDDYDHSKPLVIDPVLRYSTYLGGSSGGTDPFASSFNSGSGVAVDAFGFTYVVGNTTSVDFPTTSGSFEPSCPLAPQICTARLAVFAAKLNRTGRQLVYATYLTADAGTDVNSHSGKLIAVDQEGNVHIAGITFGGGASPEFPTTITALQRVCPFETDSTCAFYAKLNFDGSQLLYSTYYGTQNPLLLRKTIGTGLAIDNQGNAYLTGITEAHDLITTSDAVQPTFGGGSFDAFVAKFNPHLSGTASLVYGTYLGRSGNDEASGIAVDNTGSAYVVGTTDTNQFPHAHSFGTGTGGTFLVKLGPKARSLQYSTLLHRAVGTGIAVDDSHNVFITGGAVAGFPTTAGVVQPKFGGGGSDAFVTKFNTSGSALVYSTFFGGSNTDIAEGVALDAAGHAFIVGTTSSSNLRVTPATMQSKLHGSKDAFVTEFYIAGTNLIFSTYFGGSKDESGNDIAVDSLGTAYVTGDTQSTDLKVTSGAFQQTNRGAQSSGFVAKLSPAADLALTKTASVQHAPIGSRFTYSLHVVNNGPEPTLNVILFDPLPEGVIFLSTTAKGCDKLTIPAVGTRGDVTCKRGFLTRSATLDVIITVEIEPPVGGSVLNEAVVFSDGFDPKGANNVASSVVYTP